MSKITTYVRRYLGINSLAQEVGAIKAMQIKYRDRDGRHFTRLEGNLADLDARNVELVSALNELAERDKQRVDAEQENRKHMVRLEAAIADFIARNTESSSPQKVLRDALAEQNKQYTEAERAGRKQMSRIETRLVESAAQQKLILDGLAERTKQHADTVEANQRNLAKRVDALGRALQQILTVDVARRAEWYRQYADTAAAIESEVAQLRSWALASFADYHKEIVKRTHFLERALKDDIAERERQHFALLNLNQAIDALRTEAVAGQRRQMAQRLDALTQQVEVHLTQRARLDRRHLEWTMKAARMIGDMRAGVGMLLENGAVSEPGSGSDSSDPGGLTEHNGSTDARKLLPRPRRRLRDTIVIASYGVFDSNSAGHIAGFGNGLARLGYRVAVCGSGKITSAYSFGEPAFEFFRIQDLAANPERIIGFDGRFRPEQTVILCWTPREIVRRTVEPITQRYRIPYVVHLEDNEEHIAAIPDNRKQSKPLSDGFTDLSNLPAFLAGAAGVTVIEERLVETLPVSVPNLVLEPGVDHAELGSRLRPHRRATIRCGIGVSKSTTMIVYPGNVHRANVEEVQQLYEAVQLLRQQARDVVLVRTGKNYVSTAGFLENAHPDTGVIPLGQVERPFLVDLLKSADLFVQPGRPGPFNDYRLPSKLPEFMAIGRPIILPWANVGTRLVEGVDALLLRDGSAAEIASQVEKILADPALAARLSANARAFARRHYQWDRQARKLADFLDQVT